MARVAVITGASSGIGRASALAFARRGYRVALIARGVDGLHAARAEVAALGQSALVLPLDVADPQAIEAAADTVEREWGAIDVWVNNAMVTVFSAIAELHAEELRRVTDVMYHGAVWGTLAALRRMAPRNRGTIVQVGSALAYRSIPLQGAYCAAKAALRGFTDSLRCELIHQRSGIHLTMVQLPAVNTPQFDVARSKTGRRPKPLGKIFQPEIAAQAIVWAAEHRRRELWVGVPTEQAIMGTRIAPGLMDRLLAWRAVGAQNSSLPAAASDNLFSALPGDRGARGRFGGEAVGRSPHLWAAMHSGTLYAAAAAVAALFLAWRASRG